MTAVLAVAFGVFAASCDSKKNPTLKNDADSASFALGTVYGSSVKQNLDNFPGDPIDTDILLAAFTTALKEESEKLKMTPEAADMFLQTYFMQAQEKESRVTKEEGEKFLEENKFKPGVETTESGLQYQVITEGTGPKPTATDRVKVHYVGAVLDGSEFDSSIKRGEPAEFPLNGVIAGWTEGIQLMPVGSKYIFWIPSELAYGAQSRPPHIKPNSMLKFEVELLEIVE